MQTVWGGWLILDCAEHCSDFTSRLNLNYSLQIPIRQISTPMTFPCLSLEIYFFVIFNRAFHTSSKKCIYLATLNGVSHSIFPLFKVLFYWWSTRGLLCDKIENPPFHQLVCDRKPAEKLGRKFSAPSSSGHKMFDPKSPEAWRQIQKYSNLGRSTSSKVNFLGANCRTSLTVRIQN